MAHSLTCLTHSYPQERLEWGSQNRKGHLGISFRMKLEGKRDKFAKMMLKPEGKGMGLT